MTVFVAALQVEPAAQGMTISAWVFMLTAWVVVIWLNFFTFRRILTTKQHFDPDGIGPGHSPVPPTQEEE